MVYSHSESSETLLGFGSFGCGCKRIRIIISQVYKVQARNTRFYCTWATLTIIDKLGESPQETSYMTLKRAVSSYTHAIHTLHQLFFVYNRLKQAYIVAHISQTHSTASVARRQHVTLETLTTGFKQFLVFLHRLLYILIMIKPIKTRTNAQFLFQVLYLIK